MDRILVAVDGSDQSATALRFAAEEWPEATLVLVNVINPAEAGYSTTTGVPSGAEEWFEGAKARAEGLLEDAADLVDRDVETDTTVGRPAQAVVEYAEEHDIDHVVVGSHGRKGISRIVLGSVAEEIVRSAPVPVTVAR
ncbi:universal stress protein [Halobaculum sp. D14]|uniref:universal stress protein n=1 Tax=Halobaculum sp. D14 TaxID=3421642 RepID=UPI003EC0414A